MLVPTLPTLPTLPSVAPPPAPSPDATEVDAAVDATFDRSLRTDPRLRRYVEGLDLSTEVAPAHARFVRSHLSGEVGPAPDGSPYRAEDLCLVIEHLAAAGVPVQAGGLWRGVRPSLTSRLP